MSTPYTPVNLRVGSHSSYYSCVDPNSLDLQGNYQVDLKGTVYVGKLVKPVESRNGVRI